MKKIITSAVAAGLVLGSTATAAAAPAIDRAPAVAAADAEELEGGALIWVLLFAALAAGLVFWIEGEEDVDDLPTSP